MNWEILFYILAAAVFVLLALHRLSAPRRRGFGSRAILLFKAGS